MFLGHNANGNLIGILVMHADHFIFRGNNTFQRNVISELKRIFKVGIYGNGTFQFLGLDFKQRKKNGITID